MATRRAGGFSAMEDRTWCTARWTAAARAVESRRSDALFVDPFAETLAGDDGFEMMHRMSRYAQSRRTHENPYFAIRTRLFDDVLTNAVAAAQQIVFLGAGLDARAYRLNCLEGTRVFELDNPCLLEMKQQMLDRLNARPVCERHAIGADLTVDWASALVAAGFDAARAAVWVLEGVLAYLEPTTVNRVLGTAGAMAAASSVLLADLPGTEFLDSSLTRRYRAALENEGVPWRFGIRDPEQFFGEHGWVAKVTRPGEPGASYGRWPYAVLPRGVPDNPTSYFVVARRAAGCQAAGQPASQVPGHR